MRSMTSGCKYIGIKKIRVDLILLLKKYMLMNEVFVTKGIQFWPQTLIF